MSALKREPELLAVLRWYADPKRYAGEVPEAGSDNPVRALFADLRAVVAKAEGRA